MRILFYATNGLGLGHVTRLLAISRAVARRDPRHERLFLTRCEAGPYSEELDPFTIRIPGSSRARKAGLTPKSYFQTAHPLLWQTVASFDPHLMVVDTFPEGPEEELAPLMRWPIRKAFIYRDSRKEAFPAGRTPSLFAPYSLIIVAHEKGSVTLPEALSRDSRVHFSGPITDGVPSMEKREELRRRLGIAEGEKAAIVTLGGGGDSEAPPVLDRVAKELRARGVAVFAATGPLSRTIPASITAREWFPVWPLSPWLPAFDLAVGSGGYNTVTELSLAGLPTLLIPFLRDTDDQEKRVEEALCQGWAIGAMSLQEIPAAINRLLSMSRLPREIGTVAGGADRAAELLLSLSPGGAGQLGQSAEQGPVGPPMPPNKK
ncbi:MAG: hypothetical protein ACP5OS_07020 [Leptospirillia bacterium]